MHRSKGKAMKSINAEIKKTIKKDKMIWKFSLYGFLKNLRFFEPYLVIFLLSLEMNLFSIGLLYSVREAVTYIFEVPSGIIADTYGKKKELMACFIFYIISFGLFFAGRSFAALTAAMVFFGLGEAFRSGTHKAMIYSYLERKGWFEHKTYVYGMTRSFSLMGSAISAFLSVALILNVPDMRWIFLFSVLPYFLDFFLISTYPAYLDERKESVISLPVFYKNSLDRLKSILGNRPLRKILLSSSLYDGIFKSIKDYIQPILEVILLGGLALGTSGNGSTDALKMYLGITYGVFYIFSALASRNVYRLKHFAGSKRLMDVFFDIMGIGAIAAAFAIWTEQKFLAIAVFFLLYILKDARRPLFVDVSGDLMKKTERATSLSVDSQLKSIFMIVLAPLFGFIADRFSMEILFAAIGIASILANRYFHSEN
ncbi:MAG TPA: MFS transporter [Clostridia bacterium]|nr:MFS transporter [Clostridia bacterium]